MKKTKLYKLPNGLKLVIHADSTRHSINANLITLFGGINASYLKDANGNYIEHTVSKDDSRYPVAYNQKKDEFFKSEQRMIANYIDTKGQIINNGEEIAKAGSDYQINLESKTMVDEIKENKLDYLRDSQGNVNEDPLWDDIDSVGKSAEQKAYEIENGEDYRDATTLDQNLHSENRQSFWSKQ